MASHVQGIAITIKAFLPTGKTLDEQFAALSIVKDAHASGDYSKVLAAAKIDEVKAEQKTRRVDDAPLIEQAAQEQPPQDNDHVAEGAERFPGEPAGEQSDDGVPEFLKKGKNKAA